MLLDKKAVAMLSHYRDILERQLFDEYDVLGFLIFIRSYISCADYPDLYDFCDLIAHRNRNRGNAMSAISGAIENDYTIIPEGKSVKGYNGIDTIELKDEVKKLGSEFGIAMNDCIIDEMMICLFSLIQFTTHKNKKYEGRAELCQMNDGCLAVLTTEGKPHSLYICFAKIGPFQFLKTYPAGHISSAIEAVRIDGELRLRDVDDENLII